MSTDIEFDTFEAEDIEGDAHRVRTLSMISLVQLRIQEENQTVYADLTAEQARALGWALLRAAASLEWTT